mmetsp:Transcript_33348/g.53839  ORF Transcript_33348/g.53839 Transcript_33348/m.53839 type:complete len:795 (-) Transcript_33348:88-2472(-)
MVSNKWLFVLMPLVVPAFGADVVLNLGLLSRISDARNDEASCDSQKWVPEQKICSMGDVWLAAAHMGFLAVDHFNNRNDTYVPEFGQLAGCNKKINPLSLDSGSMGQPSIRAVMKALADNGKVHGFIGPGRSAAAAPVAMLTGALDIVAITWWATSNRLSNRGEYPTFLRTIGTNGACAYSMCQLWVSQGFRYAAFSYVNDAFGEDFKEAVVKYCSALGMSQVFTFAIDGTDREQIREQVARMRETGVNVFGNAGDIEQKIVLEEAFKVGIVGNGTTWSFAFGFYGGGSEKKVEDPALAEALRGSFVVTPVGGSAQIPSWAKLVADWKNLDVDRLNEQVGHSYFQAPSDLYTKVDPYNGEIQNAGAFMYDAVALFGLAACKMYPTANLSDSFGKELADQVATVVNFTGVTGRVVLDSNGDRALETINNELHVVDIDPTTKVPFQTLYSTYAGDWAFEKELVFNGWTSVTPNDVVIPVEDKQLAQDIYGLCKALFSVNLLLSISFTVWTLIYRKHAIIRASQTRFLVMISCGTIVSSTTLLFLIGDDADDVEGLAYKGEYSPANSSCMAALWFYGIGFMITFGSLFAKMWRVNKLFNVKNLKRVNISNAQLFGICAALILLDTVIIGILQAVDPLVYTRTLVSATQFGDPIQSVGKCYSESAEAFVTVLACVHIAVLIYGNYIAYQARNISTSFSESKYVSMALVSNLQVMTLGIPVLIITADKPTSRIFTQSGIVFLNDLSTMLFIFVPKVVAVIKNPAATVQSLVSASTSHSKGRQPGVGTSGTSAMPTTVVD